MKEFKDYEDKIRYNIFDAWKNKIVQIALQEGDVDLERIEWLHRETARMAFEVGYEQGHKDGYSQAVLDVDKEKD